MRSSRSLGIIYAFSAAILFGISTPLAKLLIGEVRPVMLAGLLYGGSGLGLSAWMMLRKFQRGKEPIAHLTRQDAPWRAGAVWLHVTERHEHQHTHEEMAHEHAHVHDEHHQHEHEGWSGATYTLSSTHPPNP